MPSFVSYRHTIVQSYVSYRHTIVKLCISYRHTIVQSCISYRHTIVQSCILYRHTIVQYIYHTIVQSYMSYKHTIVRSHMSIRSLNYLWMFSFIFGNITYSALCLKEHRHFFFIGGHSQWLSLDRLHCFILCLLPKQVHCSADARQPT